MHRSQHQAFRKGWSIDDVFDLTGIDRWFLVQIEEIIKIEEMLKGKSLSDLDATLMRHVKRKGFSDSRLAELTNAGARELGYADFGAMQRSKYDMSADEFAAETERMWQEVKPLYMSLHTYVRGKLNEKYGDEIQPASGPIRADLLGNMWAQEWGNIYPLVAPEGAGDIGYDLTSLIEEKGHSEVDMVRIGENFFSSLGFAPLPDTFYERSQFVKPEGREVVCHASAWDVENSDDLRIKMCIKRNSDDFITIHHELGHNYYQRAYNQQDYLHLNGANDGFHEAIGDMKAKQPILFSCLLSESFEFLTKEASGYLLYLALCIICLNFYIFREPDDD